MGMARVMSNEYLVVGEYRADDQWLLVQGADGSYYSYHPRRQRLVRVTLDEQWVLYAAVDSSTYADAMPPAHTDHDGQRDLDRCTSE